MLKNFLNLSTLGGFAVFIFAAAGASRASAEKWQFDPASVVLPQVVIPEIVVPDTPDFSWGGEKNDDNDPVFNSVLGWGNIVPWNYTSSKYATNQTEKSYLIGDGDCWSYTGLVINGGNSIYVTKSLTLTPLEKHNTDSTIGNDAALYISNDATFDLRQGSLSVGANSVGTFSVDSGTATIANQLNVGTGASGNGVVYLSGGAITTNGANISSNDIGSQGAVYMTGGTFASTGDFAVGSGSSESASGGGSGVFVQTGGTFNYSGASFAVAKGMDSEGLVVFTNGTINATSVNIGFGSSGTFYQYGGSVSGTRYFCVGNKGANDNYGVYHQYGGTVESPWITLGHQRKAQYNMYEGATMNLSTGGNGLTIGDNTSGVCEFNMYGGTINAAGNVYIGNNGTATFNFLGGSIGADANLSINARSSLNIIPGLDGPGTIDVGGTFTQNGTITLNLDHGLGCWTAPLDGTVDVLSINAGSTPNVTNNTVLLSTSWEGNKLSLSLVPNVVDGVVTFADITFATAREVGVLQIDDLGGTSIAFDLENVGDAGDLSQFISWMNENNWVNVSALDDDSVLITSLGEAGWNDGFLLWDFSDYNAEFDTNVLLAGAYAHASEVGVPEPSAWVLLLALSAGILGVRHVNFRTKAQR
ncbi:MAG: hypothetical protein Q4D38_13295 [Planctomycetia bacterium]|nr:hypothetical protein [Planctomycetia bacterium]